MSDEIKKERSPNYPRSPLVVAIELVKKLHEKAGKGKLSPLAAVGVLGYSGMSGASLTALGTLTSYGLIERERGSGITVSPLAIKLLHPLDAAQERFARTEAALFPKVFRDLYSDGHRDTNPEVIKNHLIQNGFTPDGAANAAAVYVANFTFANLSNDGRLQEKVEAREDALAAESDKIVALRGSGSGGSSATASATVGTVKKHMLAQYSIPIGSSEATITFTGERLSVEDFDALADYIAIFKKQFERKSADDGHVEMVVDVSQFETNEQGDYILPKFWGGDGKSYDYVDLPAKTHIWSIGKRKSDGKIFASTTSKFYENKDFECLWLR